MRSGCAGGSPHFLTVVPLDRHLMVPELTVFAGGTSDNCRIAAGEPVAVLAFGANARALLVFPIPGKLSLVTGSQCAGQ
ncbi:MAG TPA: hypothetical protein VMT96_00075 [Candidatus Bathyarchaeia archaeon]|nr:hypothetical protein [Candidatus Bathyarchaeia archaeon]